MKLIPVVLNGGVGSRLWPVSREGHPKPFMSLPDGQTLLQKTYARASRLANVCGGITVTNSAFHFKSQDELAKLDAPAALAQHHYLLEPVGRNTAAAVVCAALEAQAAFGPEAILLVMPSDHLIANEHAFQTAVESACALAVQNQVVTFGIQPSHPHTGFGYIEASGSRVARFVEKPDLKTAQTYLAAGRYLWNSGMFCATAACFLEQFGQHAPLIVERASLAWRDGKRQTSGTEVALSFGEALFTDIPSDSIDYAVMEKTSRAAVVACNLGWSDVGSWEAVSELTAADAQGNRALGQARLHDCKNTFVWSDGRIAAAVGVENLVIVDTPDALLVAHRDQAQDVKHIFNALKAENHETHRLHQTVFRPWGSYTVLEDRPGYKVKRIEVKPGAALSLQMHHHRSEHWIVGQGSAEVVNGDALLQLSANQSTYIPAGAKHRLTNTGKDLLVLLEVQIGSYLGEDDIVRFEDRYGRA